ncbi:phage tail terminator protein [Pararhizobium sp.]|uniref:phage tail terminator protein n=1 Tax=Pararhizobium sp. TaxID=1977563 RepID=UPI003D13ADFF
MIAEIKQRLLESGTKFALVEGATELAQVKDRPTALPAAYVIPLEEVSSPNSRATGPILQRTEADIGVVIILENVGSADGDAVTDELETVKNWTRRQLVGLEIGDADPIEHVAGEIIKARNGTVWFQHTFSVAYFEQEE